VSKKDQDKKPWDQPIYDTSKEEMTSRSERRNKSEGKSINTVVLIMLVFLVVGVAVFAYFMLNDNKEKNTGVEKDTNSSVPYIVEGSTSSSTKETSTSTKETTSETEKESSSSEVQQAQQPEQQNQQQAQEQQQAQQPEAGGSYTVQAGDNLYRIALNHGMTTQELANLNGITPDTTLSVGQVLRTK